MLLVLTLVTVGGALAPANPPPPGWQHPVDRLQYQPTIDSPTYQLISTSTNGHGKLYKVLLSNATQYGLAPVLLLDVDGSASDAGDAYGELLGSRIETVRKACVLSTAITFLLSL